MARRGGGGTDYAQAGRDLLERVNLRLDGAPARYAPANPIYEHRSTGAQLFVGNATLAADRAGLTKLGITRIVFCQDRDGRMHFTKDPTIEYLPYKIGRWREWTVPTATETVDSVLSSLGAVRAAADPRPVYLSTMVQEPETYAKEVAAFFYPLFDFVRSNLDAGNNVLIHCLAGAHRAGTAGVACIMHLCGLNTREAITIAKTARPAIDPIGDFPKLLRALEVSMQQQQQSAAGSGGASGSGGSGGAATSKAPRGAGKLDVLATAFDQAGLRGGAGAAATGRRS